MPGPCGFHTGPADALGLGAADDAGGTDEITGPVFGSGVAEGAGAPSGTAPFFVFWKKADVIHAGDVVVFYAYPFFDSESGGDIRGLVAAVDRILALSDAGTRIIGGHGPLGSRADLIEYRDMLAGITNRVAGQLAAGKSLPEVIASRPSADYDARWAKPGTMPADTFVALIYRSLLPRPGT